MTKARLHPTVLEFRGAMGDMLFKKRHGRIYASIKPDMSGIQPSEAQLAQRERFSEAVAYGKTIMADEEARFLYEQAAKEKDMPVFALTVADFLNPPVIRELNLTDYNGQVDDIIKVKAADDFGVASVRVTIANENGDTLESGDAIETAPNSGLWLYSATSAVTAGTTVHVNVIVTDRPGGTVVDTQIKTL